MDTAAILDRITRRIADMGLSAQAVSVKAGLSKDGIRNWQRRAESGAGMNMSSLTQVAEVLGVPVDWLLNGGQPPAPPAHNGGPPGLADEACPFTGTTQDIAAAVRTLFGGAGRNVSVTHRASAWLPDLGIAPGDLIVCDLARLPEPGELAIVTAQDEDHATSASLIRRYLPPWLVPSGPPGSSPPVQVSTPGIAVRHPVVGIIRNSAALAT